MVVTVILKCKRTKQGVPCCVYVKMSALSLFLFQCWSIPDDGDRDSLQKCQNF